MAVLSINVDFVFNTTNNKASCTFDPDTEQVPWGDCDTIQWNLVPKDQNGNAIAATFSSDRNAQGVYFLSTDDPPWPGSAPNGVNGTCWQVVDDNRGDHAENVCYNYGVHISYNNSVYNYDPKIENVARRG